MFNPGWFIVLYAFFLDCIICLPHQTATCEHPCELCPLVDKETEIPLFGSCNACVPECEMLDCTGTMKNTTTSKISLYCASDIPQFPTQCTHSITPDETTAIRMVNILVCLLVLLELLVAFVTLVTYKKFRHALIAERTKRNNSVQTANASASTLATLAVQRESIKGEVLQPLSTVRDEGDCSDDVTVTNDAENDRAGHKVVSAVQPVAPCSLDEEECSVPRDSVVPALGVQRDRKDSQHIQPFTPVSSEGDNSDEETVKSAGENDSSALEGVSIAPGLQGEDKTICTVSTTVPPDKTVDGSDITQEDFQQLKADLWTRHMAKDFASSLQSQISPRLLEIVATPTEQKQVEEEAMNMAKFWIKQDSGVPYLQLRDLFVDYKEAQYISTARQRAKDPAFVQANCRE